MTAMPASADSVPATITAAELGARLQGGQPALIIDVRTPGEFRGGHAVPAQNLPLDSLDPAALRRLRAGDDSAPLHVICQSGARSAIACERLRRAGLVNVVNILGGTQAWREAGLPVEKSAGGVISLERQVRIAAGALILTGFALARFVHPWFLALPAFVGAGLLFAGVTDTCGMALLLARLPWNRR
jgi:rhodanese-related sulfurtransferase